MSGQQSLSVGLEPQHCRDLLDALQVSAENGYDFTCVPLVHPRNTREHDPSQAAASRQGPFTRPDLLLNTSDWSSLVVGVLTPSACSGCDTTADLSRHDASTEHWEEVGNDDLKEVVVERVKEVGEIADPDVLTEKFDELTKISDALKSSADAKNTEMSELEKMNSTPPPPQNFNNPPPGLPTLPFTSKGTEQTESSTKVAAITRPNKPLDNSTTSHMTNSEASLLQELSLASHLSLSAVMVTLTSDKCVNLARVVHNRLTAGAGVSFQVWARVPMVAMAVSAARYRSDIAPETVREDTWSWWNTFHTVADLHRKISLCLEVSEDIPDACEVDRWLGEPVRVVVLRTSLFVTNPTGFPVLSRPHQALLKRLNTLHPQYLITGASSVDTVKFYQQYLDHILQNKSQDPADVSQFARGYEDFLQCPLQPLMDNLESQTYEVFERDPVKYRQYETAVERALIDKVPDADRQTTTVVVMVVGAGRGPLVRRSLRAAQTTGRTIKVYALEKNPNAVLTLHALQEQEWGDKVTVVCGDMRAWQPPEKADILVSELLGSFGDNELSPECLDGAQRLLKDDGISIPYSYTSSIAPLHSPKLYNEVRSCREKDKHVLAHFETPYVVFLHNKHEVAPSQELFTFTHPNTAAQPDNRRYGRVQFPVTQESVLHGIGGYFEAVLYRDVTLSIRPQTHSPGMFSWFPIFFPIKEPMPLSPGDVIDVHFWRCVTPQNVWYEWCVTGPSILPVHNPRGRSYTIGL